MTPIGGSDMILLMLTGVAVVLITVRLMVRAHRIKQQAIEEHYSTRRPMIRRRPVNTFRARPANGSPLTVSAKTAPRNGACH